MTQDLRKRKHININYLPFAFLFPFLGYCLVMVFKGVMPFDKDWAFLYSDSYYQYYPFFKEFRRALLSGDSLLYTWSTGMGMDYLGLISYYLASPLNWLVILVPESLTLEYFTFLIPVRIGLAGLFFAIFLKRHFGKNDISLVAFGGLYATCAWALGYQWNLMWLDTFALLPLVALGTISLLRDKKFILYTLTLFASIFSNYYIGFFTCIFVLLLFIFYQICNFTTFRRFLEDLLRIALFSVLAIGMTAVLELPALAALGNTVSMSPTGTTQEQQSFLEKIPKEFRLNMIAQEKYVGANGAYTAMKDALNGKNYGEAWHSFKTMVKFVNAGLKEGFKLVFGNTGGGLTPNFVSDQGLPNVYCGVGSLYLACLFLTARGIKFREKLCCLLMLVILTLSFLIRTLDYIWHGFHFPNMIPYRFSFIFSFVVLYMAYRAYLQRHKFQLWQIALAGALTFAVLNLSRNRNERLFMVFNVAFVMLNLGVLCVGLIRRKAPQNADKKEKQKYLMFGIHQRQVISVVMCLILMVEVALNLAHFGTQYPSYALINSAHYENTGERIVTYPTGGQDTYDIVAIMKEYENRELFYRAETTHCQLYNDGAMLDYNGVSTFSSSADVDTTVFLKSLGIAGAATWNRYAYEQTSPVTNLFLNVKYMIERTRQTFPQNSYFDPVYTVGNATLLENNAYLPLGFLTQPQLANTEFAPSGNRFDLQNQLIVDATGLTDYVWIRQESCLAVDGHNLVTYYNDGKGTVNFYEGRSAYRCVDCNSVAPYSYRCSSCGAYSGGEACACGGNVLPANHYPCVTCGGRIDTGVYITYTYTPQRDGLFCIDLVSKDGYPISNCSYFTARLNGTTVMSYENVDVLTQMLSLCDVKKGDTLEIMFHCNSEATGAIYCQAAILDETRFRKAYDVLSTSTLQLTTFSNTLVEGYIDCYQDGLLYTSIPDNGNWVAYVDDVPTPIVVIGNAMVGVPLTQGGHTVTFRYKNQAFHLGLTVSLICLAVFITACVIYNKSQHLKGKYEK